MSTPVSRCTSAATDSGEVGAGGGIASSARHRASLPVRPRLARSQEADEVAREDVEEKAGQELGRRDRLGSGGATGARASLEATAIFALRALPARGGSQPRGDGRAPRSI